MGTKLNPGGDQVVTSNLVHTRAPRGTPPGSHLVHLVTTGSPTWFTHGPRTGDTWRPGGDQVWTRGGPSGDQGCNTWGPCGDQGPGGDHEGTVWAIVKLMGPVCGAAECHPRATDA